jgi:diaminopimelate decarboxylase
VILEPGRSLVGRAGVSLYRVGVIKRASADLTYVAVDGGMSDNPRPQLYGARYSALLANRADEEPAHAYDVCGKHCESGDVLIEGARLPEPRRGDLLAVPATGAYTLSMGSNYNSVPRPAAVLVADGEAQVIRRRETGRRPHALRGSYAQPIVRTFQRSRESSSSASRPRCGASTA